MMGILTAVAMLFSAGNLNAQNKVENKYLVGVWLMESMQWNGEETKECGTDYTQIKVFGADGEYACAQVVKLKDGSIQILPHEYGTYTYSKDGVYTEMGRKTDCTAVIVVDKNHFHGWWFKRHDKWRRATDMPKDLVQEVVGRCKAQAALSADMQEKVKRYMFK